MARCPMRDCDWKGLKAGIPIHLARKHGLRQTHPEHNGSDSHSTTLASESRVCPVIGCNKLVEDVKLHALKEHPDWILSNGRFVFEVV
jgi:hypothetical protein